MNRKLIAITIFLSTLFISNEVSALPKFEIDKGTDLELYQQVQVWNITTLSSDSAISSRNDTYIRRGRLGVRGHFYKSLFFYNVLLQYDNLGKDGFTKTMGTAQSTENSSFGIYETLFTLELDPRLNFTAGYFRPQVGRESLSSDFDDSVFEKSFTNPYLRTHILGRGNGRETGINFGGINNDDMWGINYNIGIFDTNHEKITGGTSDSKNGSSLLWSPLIAGRIAFSIGEPELNKYKLGSNVNYFGKRDGVTIAANYSYQGNTDILKNNNYLGFDLLANYKDFNLSSEYDILGRTKSEGIFYSDLLFHAKASYNIHLMDDYILEPALMYSFALIDQKSTLGVSESLIDIGLNWYMNKNSIKINAHFIQKQNLTDSKKNSNFIGIGTQFQY